jgi:predicted molibdopterin-dependent oxidoreductase YjgC
MRTEPVFRVMESPARKEVEIFFEEQPFAVPAGISVASALLLIGAEYTRRSPVTNAKRAPYCMMGVCFECLVEIDGHFSQQGCLVEVRAGMRISRQSGAAAIGPVAPEVRA